jgi:succinate dehydrogenase / fumarate reductase cytochrome b subunit
MTSITSYLRTTIGLKKIVGLSGLGFALFLLSHMAGNLLILVGPEAYNNYSYKLVSTSLIYVAEAGLVAAFLLHATLAIRLTLKNKAARPVGYVKSAYGEKRTSWAAKTLILSGLLILVFTVLHLITFKWGSYYAITYNGVEMRDLHRLIVEKFHQPAYVAFYEFCLVVLGVHLSHGVAASFQSLGVASVRTKGLRCAGKSFAFLVTAGFMLQPLYVYFFYPA